MIRKHEPAEEGANGSERARSENKLSGLDGDSRDKTMKQETPEGEKAWAHGFVEISSFGGELMVSLRAGCLGFEACRRSNRQSNEEPKLLSLHVPRSSRSQLPKCLQRVL